MPITDINLLTMDELRAVLDKLAIDRRSVDAVRSLGQGLGAQKAELWRVCSANSVDLADVRLAGVVKR